MFIYTKLYCLVGAKGQGSAGGERFKFERWKHRATLDFNWGALVLEATLV